MTTGGATRGSRSAGISHGDQMFRVRVVVGSPLLPDGFFAVELLEIDAADTEHLLYSRHYKAAPQTTRPPAPKVPPTESLGGPTSA